MKCPVCDSLNVLEGHASMQDDEGGEYIAFRPAGLRFFTFRGYVPILDKSFSACVKCGHIWAKVAPQDLASLVERSGSKILKQTVALNALRDTSPELASGALAQQESMWLLGKIVFWLGVVAGVGPLAGFIFIFSFSGLSQNVFSDTVLFAAEWALLSGWALFMPLAVLLMGAGKVIHWRRNVARFSRLS